MGAKCCRSDEPGSLHPSAGVLTDPWMPSALRQSDPEVGCMLVDGLPDKGAPWMGTITFAPKASGSSACAAGASLATCEGSVHTMGSSATTDDLYRRPGRCRLSTEPTVQLLAMDPGQLPAAIFRAHSDGTVLKDPSRKSSVSSTTTNGSCEQICCLAWSLSSEAAVAVKDEELWSLHQHVHTCIRLFEAEVLADTATSGLVRGCPRSDSRLTAADTAMRLGQLICRFGASSGIGLRVGVHSGAVRQLRLPCAKDEARTVYFGEACTGATQLAETGLNWQVHISVQARAKLSAFRQAHMTLARDQMSYYLRPTTAVGNFFGARDDRVALTSAPAEGLMSTGAQVDRKLPAGQLPNSVVRTDCTLEEFAALLLEHDVDVASFGKGSASSLDELYKAVVHERRNDLILSATGRLERVVNLVRVSLRIRDGENKLRELRLVSESLGDGGRGGRNMPLAITLNLPEAGKWKEALEQCFEHKLRLPARVQRASFQMHMETYKYMEEYSKSERFPGLMTTYKSHNIVINIKDRQADGLRGIGLPQGEPFSFQAEDGTLKHWMWAPVGDTKEDELMNLLQSNGIDASELEPHAFAQLHDEVYTRFLSVLEQQRGELVRTVGIIKVWLHVSILNVDHVLTVKTKFRKGRYESGDKDRPISMRLRVDQDWEDGVGDALSTRLGLPLDIQAKALTLRRSSHRLSEEIGYSKSYPGLKTAYMVNEVNVYIIDPQIVNGLIGLPSGTEFAFARREDYQGPETGEYVVTHFQWTTKDDLEQRHSILLRTSAALADEESQFRGYTHELDRNTSTTMEGLFCCRVPSPEALHVPGSLSSTGSPSSPMTGKGSGASGSVAALAALMRGRQTNWSTARRAARKIRDRDYTCKHFHDDLVESFPELRLYMVQDPNACTSGRTPDDEYQRTMGALFAIYWILRLDMGGQDGFCFGVDDEGWWPRTSDESPADAVEAEQWKKRVAFRDAFDWGRIWSLLRDAGLLFHKTVEPQGHDPERVLAMLVLMAIHDIMKVTPLLPTVDRKAKEFCGYKTGELISDHDAALSYVLEYHPELLPSFAGLPKAQQESVRFTHCKLDYNMGWLVQAEASPGALFRTFRKVVTSGQASSRDIAFYFVHWFTDLAGAEPTPLSGCEKFALRFPQHVLSRFMESFSFVQGLSPTNTETQVLEDYLVGSWERARPSLGPAPEGQGAVAKMRLLLMAQADGATLMRQYEALCQEDRHVLAEEMAITGCRDQVFKRDSYIGGKGPAILLYYSPALLQKMGCKDPSGLIILAEVWRQARELWPLSRQEADSTVTVRIDALKDLESCDVFASGGCHIWVVCRTSSRDGVVKQYPAAELKCINWADHQVVAFSKEQRRRPKAKHKHAPRLTDLFKPGGRANASKRDSQAWWRMCSARSRAAH